MTPSRIVEAVDVFEDGDFGITTRSPGPLPQQLSLDGFEERLDRRIVIAFRVHLNAWRSRSTLCRSSTLGSHAGAGFSGNHASRIGCPDRYDECTLSAACAGRWPCSRPGPPDRASSDCSQPLAQGFGKAKMSIRVQSHMMQEGGHPA